MTLIASIITSYKKKKIGKKRLPSTLDMEPSTLDKKIDSSMGWMLVETSHGLYLQKQVNK